MPKSALTTLHVPTTDPYTVWISVAAFLALEMVDRLQLSCISPASLSCRSNDATAALVTWDPRPSDATRVRLAIIALKPAKFGCVCVHMHIHAYIDVGIQLWLMQYSCVPTNAQCAHTYTYVQMCALQCGFASTSMCSYTYEQQECAENFNS
jgi:hypothetical protein